jgi:hypothetical protein
MAMTTINSTMVKAARRLRFISASLIKREKRFQSRSKSWCGIVQQELEFRL